MSKRYLPVIVFILIFCDIIHSRAQTAESPDTIPYILSSYHVKKGGVNASAIAKKLKVDAGLIVKLNRFRDENAPVPAGTSVLVPVYLKEKNNESHHSPQPQPLPETVTSHVDSVKSQPVTLSPADIELQKNRLLLIDAVLDLNQTLLQGVRASIDSLNVEDKPLTDEKNVQAKLHQMERQRDRILIKPYLAHIQDSLKTEIFNEEKEKGAIEAMLSGKAAAQAGNNAVPITHPDVAQSSTQPDIDAKKSSVNPPDSMTSNKQVLADNKPLAKKTGNSGQTNLSSADTLKTAQASVVHAPQSKRVEDVTHSQDQAVQKHWEIAKALPSLTETFFLQGLRDIPAISENTPSKPTRDTLAYVPQSRPRNEVEVANKQPDVISDSIELIKAQLLVTRATAAINSRDNALAEDYLQKAVDLDPNYYGAWFALADLHLQGAYPAKALNEFKICERLDSSSAKLYYKMGNAAFRTAQKNDAYKYFLKSLDIDSNYTPSMMGLGQTLSEKKQYNVAIATFGHVLTMNKGFHSAYKSRGIAEYMIGNFAAAIDDFTTYLLFEDKDGASYYYRGVSEIANQDLADGCIDLTTALLYKYSIAQKAFDKNCAGSK